MYPDTAKTICYKCPKAHVDNCEGCYGFGVYATSQGERHFDLPVRASDAIEDQVPSSARPCPTCGSTPAGLPIFPFAYVGGGHFRALGVPVGVPAETLHGQQAVEYLLNIIEALRSE